MKWELQQLRIEGHFVFVVKNRPQVQIQDFYVWTEGCQERVCALELRIRGKIGPQN